MFELALVGLLRDAPAHGYELMERYQATLAPICHLEMSNLYSVLRKLEAEGWVEGDLQPQGSRPPRRVFSVTRAGEQAFQDWLRVPVPRPRDIRVEFLLKLWFARRLGPEPLAQLIDRQIAACDLYVDHLEEAIAASQDDFEQTVLRVRQRAAASTAEWLREYRATGSLARPGVPPASLP